MTATTTDKKLLGSYRPEQQAIAARVFTSAGWVTGDIRAPKNHIWLEHLSHCGPWIKLTDAVLPGDPQPVDFFALARGSAVLIEPAAVDPRYAMQPILGDKATHRVDCLLDVGVASGSLELAPNIRVSDHLAQKTDFMGLRDCSLRLFGRFGEVTLEMRMPLVFVNCGLIVGVSEMD